MKDDIRGAGIPSPVTGHLSPTANGRWVAVCRLEDIVPNTGVCALVGRRQVAVFRLYDDSVYALSNHDRFSRANKVELNPMAIGPGVHGAAGEFTAIVHRDGSRCTTLGNHWLQRLRHLIARERLIGEQAEAFTGELIDSG